MICMKDCWNNKIVSVIPTKIVIPFLLLSFLWRKESTKYENCYSKYKIQGRFLPAQEWQNETGMTEWDRNDKCLQIPLYLSREGLGWGIKINNILITNYFMTKLFKILLLATLLFSSFSVYAIWDIKTVDPKVASDRGNYLDIFKAGEHFSGNFVWEKWARNLLLTVAKDAKNIFIAIAVLYLFVTTIKLFFWTGWEEDIKKWRLSILWVSIWIIIMQISYVAFASLYDKWISESTAAGFSSSVLSPIIKLMWVMASFIFIGMAILSFYWIITGGWSEEKYKKWVQGVQAAIIWFILVKISATLVNSIYWTVDCTNTWLATTCNWQALWNPNLSDTVKIIRSVIQYSTGFIWIIVIVLIIYTWMTILTSGWSEEKMKKAKSSLIYITIWILVIVLSVGLFQFMWWADLNWVIWSFNN